MTNYCDVEFSWPNKNNTDASLIFEYEVIDDATQPPSIPEDITVSFANHIEVINADNSNFCELKVSCKALYKVAIQKLEIISGFRLLELYDPTEGYLTSVKGRSLTGDNGDSCKLYCINCPLETAVRSINGKFVSLGGKEKIEIKKLKISVISCGDDLYSPGESNSINVAKLKSFVAELGDQVPENAKSLLEAMEQYQKNKASTVDDIKKQLCQEATGQDQSAAGMSKMMALFSQLNQTSAPSPSDSQNQLFSMISSIQNGNHDNSENMYAFLQNICGQVSNMRAPPVPEAVVMDTEENQPGTSSASNPSNDPEAVNQKLEAMEKQVMSQVDDKINALEERLTSKLDLILQGLNIQVPQQPNT